MRLTRILALTGMGLGISLSGSRLAHAMQQSISSGGVLYLIGGSSEDERHFLEHIHTRYSAWLITRDRATGRALAGVHLRVIDSYTRRVLFDRTMDDPWLLLDLPEGRFQIEAVLAAQMRRWVAVSHPTEAEPHALYLNVLA